MAVGGELGFSGQDAVVQGFDCAGIAAGIKADQVLDLALIASPAPCTAAATFTQCKFPAAPVLYDKQVLSLNASGIHGLVVNSGCANACTGPQGMANARRMAEATERALGAAERSVLVMSTGVIGVQLPMDRIEAGVPQAVETLRPEGWHDAARAFMTTDTFPKLYAGRVALDGHEVRVAGISKGAGMIHPDMATMLSVIVTDAAVAAPVLQTALAAAVQRSFNCISVDGDTSTNDTLVLLANGQSGAPRIDEARGPHFEAFQAAITTASQALAQAIVRDGEGATKLVAIAVEGAVSDAEAHAAARAVSVSPLVKTAFYGGDANWGRILCAAGNSSAQITPEKTALYISAENRAELQLVAQGTPTAYAEEDAAAIFGETEIDVRIDLGLGSGAATVWTCDFSHEYVTINGDYRT